MTSIVIPDSSISIDYNIDELTEGKLEGKGVFDVMIRSVRAHLKDEFEAGRIRGTDYANVYSLAAVQVMEQATNYALAKSKMALELQLLEAQIGQVAAETIVTTKQAALLEVQAVRETAQTTQIAAETRQIDYITSTKLPSDLLLTEAQIALTAKQGAQIQQETANLLANKELITNQALGVLADNAIKAVELDIQSFNRDFRLPKELILIEKEVQIKESQVALSNKELLVKQAQVDLAVKEIAVKQNQIELGTKELLIKQAQVSIAERELLLKAEEILVAKYQLQFKLPAEVALTKSQSDLYTQKVATEKAQIDGTGIKPNSVLDYNNKLLAEQGKGFLRSAQQNAAKILVDTWNVRHTNDPDGNKENSSNKLSDSTIGRAVSELLSGINVTSI